MPDILTANDIKLLFDKGNKSITLNEGTILTDLAKEALAKYQIQVVSHDRQSQSVNAPSDQDKVISLNGKGTFKELVNSNKKMIGTFISVPHSIVTEYVGKLGFDFICIDSEHAAMNNETIQSMLQGVGNTSAFGVVRVPTLSYQCISSTLDMGADAILVPQIRTVEDVLKIREYALYPPVGKRGIGPGRATDYGAAIGAKAENPDKNTSIIIQIETKEALDNLDVILEFDFYDMLFIGPGDLSMSLGIFGQFSHPKLVEAIEKVLGLAHKAGKKAGIFAGNMDAAIKWLNAGFDMVIINSELGLLAEVAGAGLKKVRGSIG